MTRNDTTVVTVPIANSIGEVALDDQRVDLERQRVAPPIASVVRAYSS